MGKLKQFLLALLLIILFGLTELNAQNQKIIDSIARLMNSPAAAELKDEKRMKNYLTLASANNITHAELALEYARKGLLLTRSIPNQRGEGMVLNMIGISYFNMGRYDSARFYYESSQKVFESIHDTMGIIHTYNNLGIIFESIGNYKQSVQSYSRVLELANMKNNDELRAYAINNMAIVYYDWQQYPLALEHYEKSLELLRKLGDSTRIAALLNNMGELYKETGKPDEALRNFTEALNISTKQNIAKTRMNAFVNIGDIYLGRNNYALASENFVHALEIARQYSFASGITDSKIKLAKVFFKTNNLEDAQLYGKEGLKLALEQDNAKMIRDAHQILYQIYQKKGMLQEALDQFVAYADRKDTLFNQNSRKELARLRTEYETDKKEKEITLLNQEKAIQQLEIDRQKSLFWLTLILALFILLAVYLMFNRNRLKQKGIKAELERQKIEIEQRLLRSQMSPHFIFNSLNSINSFILSNDSHSAQVFLTKFSELIRLILENSRKSMIPLEDEIKTLQLNLELEQIRFDQKFDFEIEIQSEIEIDNTYVPPMLVQPFIENALIHGILPKKEKGMIRLSYMFEEGSLHARITDNGIGREESARIAKSKPGKHHSLGLQLTRERLELLDQKGTNTFRFAITDLKETDQKPIGTQIDIFMPYETE
ncbi:MAG: tetratricopeptide repeat-containing sensor histidine kinase [Bacteroidales bacterium]